jgi:hypothetical protein
VLACLRACPSPSFDLSIGGNACAHFLFKYWSHAQSFDVQESPLGRAVLMRPEHGRGNARQCRSMRFISLYRGFLLRTLAIIPCRSSKLLSVHSSSTAQHHTPKPYNSRFGLTLDSDHPHKHSPNNAHDSHHRLHANGPHRTGSRRRGRPSGRGSNRRTPSSHSRPEVRKQRQWGSQCAKGGTYDLAAAMELASSNECGLSPIHHQSPRLIAPERKRTHQTEGVASVLVLDGPAWTTLAVVAIRWQNASAAVIALGRSSAWAWR